MLQKYGHPKPEALVESAEGHIRILEDMNFKDIKVSLKASNVPMTIEAYRLFSKNMITLFMSGYQRQAPPLQE